MTRQRYRKHIQIQISEDALLLNCTQQQVSWYYNISLDTRRGVTARTHNLPETPTRKKKRVSMPPPMVLTVDEFLSMGLELCGFTVNQQLRLSQETNLEWFKSLLGSLSHIYTQIWEDLIHVVIPEAHIGMHNVKRQSPAGFLVAIHFLKTYQTEMAKSGYLNMTEKMMRKWIWYYCQSSKYSKQKRQGQLHCN
eukprot:scaffold4929_cov47-Attheya_sp.AAC.1